MKLWKTIAGWMVIGLFSAALVGCQPSQKGCPPDCKKPCCVKATSQCPIDCTKPCCQKT